MVFEVWRMLVVIVVTVIDEGVGLFEVIRRLLANAVSVVREGPDAAILEVVFTLKDKFHDVRVLHCDSIIKLMIICQQAMCMQDQNINKA